jgi:glycosyltransferase involved in cell wall biosynthesis
MVAANNLVPRLTIAIPTVNRAELLGRAIDSALAQTSAAIEIIVSDNGSTDDTPEVIGRYAGRGLRTFRHPATMSAAKHGQFLMEQARGEFFLGLSDDDYLEPEFATEVLAVFDRHPDLSFVYTGCAVHYEDRAVPALVGPSVEPGTAFLAQHYAGRREVSWCACVTRVRDLRAKWGRNPTSASWATYSIGQSSLSRGRSVVFRAYFRIMFFFDAGTTTSRTACRRPSGRANAV